MIVRQGYIPEIRVHGIYIMNPLQAFAVLFCCSVVMAVKMSLLMSQGISLLMALLLMYLVAVLFMLGLQHRARQSCESAEYAAAEAALPAPSRTAAGSTHLTLV